MLHDRAGAVSPVLPLCRKFGRPGQWIRIRIHIRCRQVELPANLQSNTNDAAGDPAHRALPDVVAYFVSFVDRVNLGFAALQMVKDSSFVR